MASANLPDLDVLTFVLSDLPAVGFRRGWTHGVLAQALLPLALTGIVLLIDRWRPRRHGSESPPLRPGWVLALSYIGVYSHVLLDWLNNYGVRLLAPVDWRWFYGDAVFIIDLWLWLALGTGVWLARRRRVPQPARWALGLAVCYIAAMVVAARVSHVIVWEAWRAEQGTVPHALMVGPVPVSPLTRQVILDTGDAYVVGVFDWWTREVVWEAERLAKNAELPEVALARGDPHVGALVRFSRFPVWRVEPTAAGSRVTITDARFLSRAGGFAASTVVPDLAPK